MSTVRSVQSSLPVLAGRYEVLSPLGAGAAANVFRVHDARTGAIRAAKVLKTERAADPETVARFEDEFRVLRTLHHPHLPEVYDYGWTADGGRFLVMELVDGEPLDVYFKNHPGDVWMLLYELCETLVFVHARNLLHQDIKPSNVLVTRTTSGQGDRPAVKLIDFGLTYRRGTGAAVRLVGTAEYVAPEVARGEKTLTRAVDYYSLGATLFELLCGTPPFTGTESDVLRAHIEREPVVERGELEWAELYPHVRALLSKDPQARLAAFEEFRRAVTGRLTGGIDDLDRSYALARIDSLGMIGKHDAWSALAGWLDSITARDAKAPTASVSGVGGAGKRFLAAALRAEAALRGVRTLTPAEVVPPRTGEAVARQPTLMWSRLLELCEQEPVILVVERPASLPDEERSFVRLAGTQWELSRSRGRVLPLYFLVAVDSTTDDADVLDYLPMENALKLELPRLSPGDCDDIIIQFRGSMFDSRDARALGTFLSRFEDTGGAIQGLQQAVLRSALTFASQRWKVQPSLLTEIVKAGPSETFSRDLVASLSPMEQRIAAVLAAHPDPVPASWVCEFSGVEPDALLSVVGGSLKRLCSVSSERLSPATAAIREALRAGCEADALRLAHGFLASKLADTDRTVANDRALAHHYAQLGRVRDAARVHLRLLRVYWSTRPRERPYELIEGVCRSGLELLETHGTTVTVRTRRHLFCFYLKEWIKALWARNLFTHAKPIIDEWTKRLAEKMPASVAPRYVRSVLELEGAKSARDAICALDRENYHRSGQFAIRLTLEDTLRLHMVGDYQSALNALSSIAKPELLSPQDRFRYYVYRWMNLDQVRGLGVEDDFASLVQRAMDAGCVDEALLMQALSARYLNGSGNPRSALSEIAFGMRVAHGAGLHLRRNLFYRLAATAYGELNDMARMRICQERALQLAGSIGMRYLSATSFSRLADNERTAGRLGNSLRYGMRAVEFLGSDAPEREMAQTHISLYATQVLLHVDERTAWSRKVGAVAFLAKGQNDRGEYLMWRGRALMMRRDFSTSLDAFKEARELFASAGYPLNAAWAVLWEARVYLALSREESFHLAIRTVEKLFRTRSARFAQLDYRIVKLKGLYLFRARTRRLFTLAHECEAMMDEEPDVFLRIELLQVLFRIYARHGFNYAAQRAFRQFGDLVREVVAGTDLDHSATVARDLLVSELADEQRTMASVLQRRMGDRLGSPILVSNR